ncbi:hypothetical protein IW262DRAFT_1455227 [Armillaria fumosa]|nr:hypothetical protein IW262DRAFT_1455227 [Armillaria fumosa]
MAVLRAPKQKKRRRIGWNSHAVELYADSSDVRPASRPHHHQSWSFPATRGAGSSVKQRVVHLPVSPCKKLMNPGGTNDHIPLDYDNDIQPYSYHLDPQAYALAMAGDMEDAATASHKQVYTYNPLASFSSHIDSFLAESLRREGRGDAISQPHCPGIVCENDGFFYRCLTCRDARLFCQACIVTAHLCSPTHIIQHWNGDYFDKTPLRKLGLQYQDNFEAFIHIVREWSFIRLLKRAGIGNNTSGWEPAKPASCAVECLACPHPGINIPVKSDPDLPTAWEDTLFVGVDANFKLERFEVSSEEKDPRLGQALSYFVDTKAFKDHLINFDKRIIQPWSTCNNHEAAKGDKKTQA